jgi:hypothetical protein
MASFVTGVKGDRLLQLDLTQLPDASDGGRVHLRADREGHCVPGAVAPGPGAVPGAVALVTLVVALTTSGLCPFQPYILTKLAQGGLQATVSTSDTISQPVGGHNLAAERKVGKVSHEEKTSVLFFLAVSTVSQYVCYGWYVLPWPYVVYVIRLRRRRWWVPS